MNINPPQPPWHYCRDSTSTEQQIVPLPLLLSAAHPKFVYILHKKTTKKQNFASNPAAFSLKFIIAQSFAYKRNAKQKNY